MTGIRRHLAGRHHDSGTEWRNDGDVVDVEPGLASRLLEERWPADRPYSTIDHGATHKVDEETGERSHHTHGQPRANAQPTAESYEPRAEGGGGQREHSREEWGGASRTGAPTTLQSNDMAAGDRALTGQAGSEAKGEREGHEASEMHTGHGMGQGQHNSAADQGRDTTAFGSLSDKSKVTEPKTEAEAKSDKPGAFGSLSDKSKVTDKK